MKHFDDISLSVDRFLDGQTSLAEERRLDEFFLSHEADLDEMSEHLQIAAEMFRELRSMRSADSCAIKTSIPRGGAKRHTRHWIKWAGAIAAACLAVCVVLFSPNDTDTKSEETTIKVAQLPELTPPDIKNGSQTESEPTVKQIVEAPKNNPLRKHSRPVEPRPDQEIDISPVDIHEPQYEQTIQNGHAMLCGFDPGANMLPMHSDFTTPAVISECEMAILEEEFQKSERSRQTIEI